MESSQVSWPQGVHYDELLKQCPYLALKGELPIVESSESHLLQPLISKSKKKRLKKRLKAISVIENLPEKAKRNTDNNVTSTVDQNVTNSSHPLHTTALKYDKEPFTTLQERVSESRKPIRQGCHTNTTDMSSKARDSHSQRKGGNKSPKVRVPDVVDGEILRPNCNINVDGTSGVGDASKKAKHQPKLVKVPIEIKPLIPDSESGQHCNINKPKQVIEVKHVNAELEKVTPGIVPNVESRNTVSKISQSEKSREEILAEREAKKKAKQLAKLKKVEKCDTTLPQKTGEETNKSNQKYLESGVPSITETKIDKTLSSTDSIVKSKAELRAERRSKQEAQRAAKESEKKLKAAPNDQIKDGNVSSEKPERLSSNKDVTKETKVAVKTKVISQQRIKLFSHLHVGSKPSQIKINQNVHPSVIRLGVKYSSRIINGSNARCVALLNCLKEVITDYTTPAEKEFSRGLESKLGELTNYLNGCRPISVSMTNALRHIKSHLTQLPNNVSDDEAKRKLVDVIDTFIREQIDVAGEAICETVKNKIANGDVILIYSCSSLLYRILTESHRSGRLFSVVVVDGAPWYEGREMLRRLVAAGLNCSYVQVSAISFIMRQATKVLLGAHALLANGCVMSRAGASMVALAAHSCNVPVLVCCETYKFCERVQTDAFVYNELGGADEIAKEDERLVNWQSLGCLSPLSLVYDITPPDLVTAVVTELAILPCTSVPVILRIKPSDLIS